MSVVTQHEFEAMRQEAELLQAQVEEQRTRRIDLEQELASMEETWRTREPTGIRYVERKVYTPMPPRIIKIKGPTRTVYVDRPNQVETIFVRDNERKPGFFGRIGDTIDGWFPGWRS